jgi:FtsZ-binding cell division protein ZapB
MPLVNTIKLENEHLKHQREQIQTEMGELHKLSQSLLSENQQLRKHHSLRTQDIRKLIETISINTHEEIGDINHQSFLLRESNHALVKKI